MLLEDGGEMGLVVESYGKGNLRDIYLSFGNKACGLFQPQIPDELTG